MNLAEDNPSETTDPPRPAPSGSDGALNDPRVVQATEEYSAALKAGHKPDRQTFLARYPDLAGALAECLDGLEMVHGAAAEMDGPPEDCRLDATEAIPSGTPLGDFRLIRQLGKGGMGVVYEAEQMSLGRRVALKVLPFAATMDPRHLQRFKNEAQAAACLHHTNIVPVHYVGCERGVHFYAMQIIEGQNLAAVIRELAEQKSIRSGAKARAVTPVRGGEAAPRTTAYQPTPAAPPAADVETVSVPQGALSTESASGPAFFRTVARLGIQAAEALEHAHQLGVVHRDVKPSNLLIDARGNLWVADFGLARLPNEGSVTMTGDLVGTLRYMSPEQALAKRVVVDHRTDIYSLGVTLYELLTLRHAYDGHDRQELLRQVAFEEPPPPRRLDRAIPAELETIVLKAMEKNPADRYATAQELADDLERYLKDEPIKARRPSLWHKARKWTRRRQGVVLTAATGLLAALLILAASIGWIVRDRGARQARLNDKVEIALREAELLHEQAQGPEAWAALQRAQGLAAQEEAGLEPDIRERLEALQARLDAAARDRRFVARFEEIRLEESDLDEAHKDFNGKQTFSKIRTAFQAIYGILLGEMPPQRVVKFIRRRAKPVRAQLLVALHVCLFRAPKNESRNRQWLQDVLATADPDPWRQKARRALTANDGEALVRLLKKARVAEQQPAFLLLCQVRLPEEAKPTMTRLLRAIQEASPGDFWANFELASALGKGSPPQYGEEIRYYTAALALRPRAVVVYGNLGFVLTQKGDLDGAIAALRRGIALDPKLVPAHHNLGIALAENGDLDGAIAAFRQAIALDPQLAQAHFGLGSSLFEKGDLDGAIAAYRQGVALNPKDALAQSNLGRALGERGDLDGAIATFRRVIALDPKYVRAHISLGAALGLKGDRDGAIAACRRAIALNPKHALAHCNLGVAFRAKGQLAPALEAFKKAEKCYPKTDKRLLVLRQEIRRLQRFLELDSTLPAILGGKQKPANASEQLEFADLCTFKRHYHAAARFSQAAFADEPKLADLLQESHRYNAACAAALAGCGKGKDAPDDARMRARLRRQARVWLRADLEGWRRLLAKDPDRIRPLVVQWMRHWLADTDLAGVRGMKTLAALPEAERKAWQQLWADVEKLLSEAQGKSVPAKKSAKK